MKTFFCLTLLTLPLAAPDLPAATSRIKHGRSFSAGAMEIKGEHYLLTVKKGYIHVLLDTFPYRQQLAEQAAKEAKTLDELYMVLLKALAEGPLKEQHPKARAFKADVVEFLGQDAYGGPDWSTVKRLGKYQGTLGPKGAAVTPAAKSK